MSNISRYIDIIFSPGFFDGELHNLINGYIYYEGLNTGFLKARNIFNRPLALIQKIV